MARSNTAQSTETGYATRVFTAFGADINFTAVLWAAPFATLIGQNGCRAIRADGAGILQMVGDDGVAVPIDVTAAGGSIAIDCSFTGVLAAGTTFVGQLVVVW